jgi:uncharacterized delta-60 repeat protein
MTRPFRLGFAAVAVLAAALPAWAAAGDPDTSFSGDGMAAFRIVEPGDGDLFDGVVVQPDGKVVGVGDLGKAGTNRSMALVVRLRENGTLDPSFSGDGVALIGMPGNTWAMDAVMGPDGTLLVVGGNETTERSDAVVFRLLPDGRLDDRFAGDGIAVVPTSGLAYGNAIVRTDDGIYVTGAIERSGTPSAMFLARFRPSGAADPTFAGDGVAVAQFGTLDAYANAIAMSGRKPVIVGSASLDGNEAFSYAAARFTAGGALDRTFSADGKASVLVHPVDWSEGQDTVVAPDGSVLIGGFTYVSPNYAHAFVRLTPGGLPDAGFGGGDGLLAVNPTPGSDWFGAMVRRGSGVVVAGGADFGDADTDPEIALFAYDASGTLDPSFGGDGIVPLDIAPYSTAYAIAKDRDGRFVAAGRRFRVADSENDVAVVRVLGP